MNSEEKPLRKVLVVDDEKVMIMLVTRLFKRGDFGVELSTASSIRDCGDLIDRNDFCLLVTDMSLPDGRGIEVINRFRAKFSVAPIIVMSGSLTIENEVKAITGANVLACLQKPFTIDEFHSAVNKALKS